MALIDDEQASSRLGDGNLARRFNDYCRASSDWVWEIDATGRFVFSSERCRDFFGASPSVLVGTSISSWGRFIGEEGDEIEIDFAAPFAGQLFETSGHDGPAEMLEVTGVPIFDREAGLFKGMFGTCKDITRQHAAEQSLRANNEELEKKIVERTRSLSDLNQRLTKEIEYHSNTKKQLNESLVLFRAIAETSPVAMFISNMDDQTIRFSNDKASELLGMSTEALAGEKITDLFIDPQNRRVVRQLVDSTRSEGVHQIRYKTSDGSMKWGQLSTHTMRIDNQSVLLTAVMDISELKNADRELAHRSRLATLGELSASIVHEINQPLSVMGMAIETAIEASGFGDRLPDPKIVRAKLTELLQQQRRLVKISDQMRGYTRNKPPDAEWFSVNQSCEYVISFLSRDFERRGIDFEFELPEEHYLVFGVPTALEQVFMNILSNARDAVEEYCSEPSGDKYRKWIRFNSVFDNETSEVEFCIWNSGPPIPEDLIDEMFIPFFSTKDSKSGTGLGLSICKRLIAGMSGTICAQNVEGGTELRVRLPFKSRDEAHSENGNSKAQDIPATPAISSARHSKYEGGQLLLVDDEPRLLSITKTFMEEAGYSVETASNGAEAMEKALAHNFDVIVTDLHMPKMDGFEFINTYRNLGKTTPIIVVSSFSVSGNGRPPGWDGIEALSKPVDYDQLISIVKKSIR